MVMRPPPHKWPVQELRNLLALLGLSVQGGETARSWIWRLHPTVQQQLQHIKAFTPLDMVNTTRAMRRIARWRDKSVRRPSPRSRAHYEQGAFDIRGFSSGRHSRCIHLVSLVGSFCIGATQSFHESLQQTLLLGRILDLPIREPCRSVSHLANRRTQVNRLGELATKYSTY